MSQKLGREWRRENLPNSGSQEQDKIKPSSISRALFLATSIEQARKAEAVVILEGRGLSWF